MKQDRRKAIRNIVAGITVPMLGNFDARAVPPLNNRDQERGSFSVDGTSVRFHHPAMRSPQSFLMLADTHLFRDDARGIPFREYSGRMAKAYNKTKHFQSNTDTDPEQCFTASLSRITEKKQTLLALVGDILSFPSEAAVEWVMQRIEGTGLPCVYTAGNHDWHYEGMEGRAEDLRRLWSAQRLKPLYQGNHPLCHCQPMGDADLLVIDNSTYEILPEQLAFFRERERHGRPMILLLHIPLFVPGRSLGFGCGHPKWNAANDRSWQLERRQPWRSEGHTQTTLDFHRAVFQSPHVIGILAGHIHSPSVDVVNGIPQIVSEANARGGFLDVELLPMA
jgi:UDP-2,3-diacylglucosamine pyrophosphatase LpxH